MNSQNITRTPDEKFSSLFSCITKLEDNFILIGELLSEIKVTKLFHYKGYNKFKDFVEAEYNLSGTLANRLISIHDLFIVEGDMSIEDATEIGLERLLVIRPLYNKARWDEREELEEKASSCSLRDLREYVNALKQKEKAENPDLRETLIKQMKERIVLLFGCSWAEATFRLSLLVASTDETGLLKARELLKKLKSDFDHAQVQAQSDAVEDDFSFEPETGGDL